MNHGFYQRYKELAAQRKERLTRLRQLLAQYKTQSQEQLVQLLSETGVNTDLETVSRDLQELQVRKTSLGNYILPDEVELQCKRQQLNDSLNKYAIDVNDRLEFLVIKTRLGHEDSVATAIESCLEERIIGTVTGHGTVLVMAETDAVGNEAFREIQITYCL